MAGASAGAISRTATAPLELVRLQAMTGTSPAQQRTAVGNVITKSRLNVLEILQAASAREGWLGLWRGNGLNVLRAGPQKAIDFFSFEMYKVSQASPVSTWSEHVICVTEHMHHHTLC